MKDFPEMPPNRLVRGSGAGCGAGSGAGCGLLLLSLLVAGSTALAQPTPATAGICLYQVPVVGETPVTGVSEAVTAIRADQWDALAEAVTRMCAGTLDVPPLSGTTPPATCEPPSLFFDTDETPGENLYCCSSTDTWTKCSGSGGGGGGAPETAEYLVSLANATLTAERVFQSGTNNTFVTGAGTAQVNVPDASTTAKGAVELATDGEGAAGLAVQGNDARLSNARTPTAHKATHEQAGGDAPLLDAMETACGSGAPIEGDGAGGAQCGTDDDQPDDDSEVPNDITVESSADIGTDLCVRIGAKTDDLSAACVCRNSGTDKLYHDSDCDSTQDAGEENLDNAPTGGTVTVEEADGAPTVTASEIEFDQAAGFTVTDQTGGVARIGFTGGGGGVPDLLHVQDVKTSSAQGGSSAAATWNVRGLNTVATNTISGASLATNQITLPAGTYRIRASAPGFKVGGHTLRLQNITDGTTTITGPSEYTQDTDNVQVRATLSGRFTIAAAKDFELQHHTAAAQATNGLGVGSMTTNTYAECWIEQE